MVGAKRDARRHDIFHLRGHNVGACGQWIVNANIANKGLYKACMPLPSSPERRNGVLDVST